MRVLFMGTPDIAAACLSSLAASHHTVAAVVCQPDKPKGRRYVLTPPPVKLRAEELGIPVHQPETLRDGALLPLLDEVKPDAVVVVAYGKILPRYLLDHPRYGCLNLHVSLLPRYRGAAPMQRAIMAGERETGVTVMYMAEGLDTGDILSTERFPIGPRDDFGTVHDRSAALGGPALIAALDALEAGTAPRIPQPEEGASYAEKITREDTVIDFSQPSAHLLAKIRGLSPIPLAATHTEDGAGLKIVRAAAGEGADAYGVYPAPQPTAAAPGTVLALSDRGEGAITVATGDGTLVLLRVKPEGRGEQSAAELIRGRKIRLGEVLGKR
ncbi:MAG: methionyl-tRNA formyltransferase [Clostridia bacterium]|nr:methionyl-tRNA formyltransferase [Clostridia bacterium]